MRLLVSLFISLLVHSLIVLSFRSLDIAPPPAREKVIELSHIRFSKTPPKEVIKRTPEKVKKKPKPGKAKRVPVKVPKKKKQTKKVVKAEKPKPAPKPAKDISQVPQEPPKPPREQVRTSGMQAPKREEQEVESPESKLPASEEIVSHPARREEEGELYTRSYIEENLSKIREAIEAYLSYPPIARRMGWEGTVVVRFVLTPEGRIEESKVEKSSGFELLDRNALRVVSTAAKNFPRPDRKVVVKVPIVYRLE